MATSPQRSDLAKALEAAIKTFASFLKEQTGETWKTEGLTLTSKVGVVLFTFPPPVGPVGEEAVEQVEGYIHLQQPGRQEKSFRGRITVGDIQDPSQSSTASHLVRAITGTEGSPMSQLRASLIRLASAHPEFRKDLLPLIACSEAPMMGKFEEGKPADPTENMSPEDKKKWEENTDRYKDKFKGATQEGPTMGKFEEGKPADPTKNMSPEDAKKWQEENEKHRDEFKTAGDTLLRNRLIRLASEHPEFRKDLLPLIKSAG